jgi:hypothetical protein
MTPGPPPEPDAPPAPGRAARRLHTAASFAAAATAAVVLLFFVIGVSDGSVSSFNIGLWSGLLGVLATVFAADRALVRRGRYGAATAVLSVLAAPGVLYLAFVLMLLILQPRWN